MLIARRVANKMQYLFNVVKALEFAKHRHHDVHMLNRIEVLSVYR